MTESSGLQALVNELESVIMTNSQESFVQVTKQEWYSSDLFIQSHHMKQSGLEWLQEAKIPSSPVLRKLSTEVSAALSLGLLVLPYSKGCFPRGEGGGVLWSFHTYVGSGQFWDSKFWISLFCWVFRKINNFWGMKILWIIFGGLQKIGLYLGVISMQFRGFS